MIFIAVGTQKFQLDRLLKMVDELVGKGVITEEVFAQSGNCTYVPKNFKAESFLTKEVFGNYIKNCDLLITHSGVATIIAGLKNQKPVIVMPRLAKYNEHVDDHQVQIANSFKKKNFILKYEENDDFAGLIEQAKNKAFDVYVSQHDKMVNTVRDYINSIK